MRLLTSILSDLRRHLPPYALSIVWLVTILTICWLPQSTIVEPTWFHIPNGDKIIHFILFFVWAIFLYADVHQKKTVLILLLGICTACLTEYLQPIISNRTCDWQDGLADITGLCIGLIVMNNIHMKKTLSILLIVLLSSNLPAQNIERAHDVIEKLASKKMHGRSPCFKGDQKTASYIKFLFSEAGLNPVKHSFFQSFSYPTQTFPKQMALSINGKKFHPGIDFIIDPVSASGKGKASIVYLDSLFFTQQTTYPEHLSFTNKAVVYDQKYYTQLSELPFEIVQKIYAAACIIEFNHTKLTMGVGSKPLSIPIFKLGKTDLQTINSGMCSFHVYSEWKENYTSNNVIGYLQGTTIPDSFLVFTAHYDHLGHLGRKTYFPGANDNASGIAMLNELAIYFSDSTHRLPYSILFIAFGGEEAGLLGSKHFTQHPLIDLKRIKFLINMDIMGTGDESITVVNALQHPKEFNTLDSLNQQKKHVPAIGKRGSAANSDHYYFSQRGVPAFFIYTNGKQKAYHDVFDVPSNLSLAEFGSLFQLLTQFAQSF